MTTVRLNKELEAKIDSMALAEHISKSEVIKLALESFLSQYYSEKTPYEPGQHLFGKHGSGRKNGSVKYKEIIKRKIGEKRHR